jgi:membrane protease YdiL (CAAX protease family)
MSVDDGPGEDHPTGASEPFDPWQPIESSPPAEPASEVFFPREASTTAEPPREPVIPPGEPARAPVAPTGPTFAKAAKPSGPVFLKPGDVVGAPPAPPADVADPDFRGRPWRWFVGPIAILIALIGVTVVSVFIVIIVIAASPSHPTTTQVTDDYEHWFGLGQDALWIVIAVTTPFLFAAYLRPGQLGMRRPPRWGVAIGVFALALVTFYAVAAIYAAAFHFDNTSNSLLNTDSGFGDSVVRDVAFALLYTVAAPVAEELLFRGLLFRTIRDGFAKRWRRSAPWIAALISGVIFGGIHYSPAAANQNNFLPVLMALGVLLALAYNFSGTIYVNILIHSINNAIATGANTHPTHDWVYILIGVGPLLAMLLTFTLSRVVRVIFPSQPRNSAHPPSAEPAIV